MLGRVADVDRPLNGAVQEQESDVYHGFIHVVLNLIRPVQMSSQPTSIYDVTDTSRDQPDDKPVTTFHLPKDTVKVIHITRCANDHNRRRRRTRVTRYALRHAKSPIAQYTKLEADCDQQATVVSRLLTA